MRVYLAGLISTDKPASLEWRERAIEALDRHCKVLSPMRGKANLKSVSNDGGISSTVNTSKDIVARDFNDIQESDVMLVHLDDFGSSRPMVGTLCELAWAWEKKMPVVAVASKDNYLMRNHPFIKEFVCHYCETVEEAIEYVKNYYLL